MIYITSFALESSICSIAQQLANLENEIATSLIHGHDVTNLEDMVLSLMKVAASLRKSYDDAIAEGYRLAPYNLLIHATLA
ncbi:MAG: hypothetical protein Q7K26_01300 [bacterium]|nr:hypothetical protein [bacterium]